MTDLERFFRRIVSNLAAMDPRRLQEPVPLAEIPVSIIPYRTNRRALQVDTSEEYEMVLLRLCSGEGGYVRTDPETVRIKFEEEVRSPNPDLEVIHRFEDVTVMLRPDRVDRALRSEAEDFHRAPEPVPLEAPEESVAAADPPMFEEAEEIVEEEVAGSQCLYCGAGLPERPVKFCPHCGQSQVAMVCPACQADIEPGWRHCVNCGVALRAR